MMITVMCIFAATTFIFGWNWTAITAAGITGSSGTGVSQLTNPFGVTLDTSNTLYIADRGNHRIQRWLENASSGTTVAGQSNGVSCPGLNCLNNSANVNIDSSGNIYVTEVFNYRVLFWPSGASLGTLVAGNGRSSSF
jgi:NHL repeat-containing protein